MQFSVDEFRNQFPLLVTPPYEPFIYADNAATTQKPQVIIDKITEFYSSSVANVHRGAYRLSEKAGSLYERARQDFKEIFGVQECIFVRGATEGLNFIAHGLANRLNDGDHILLSIAEHHANIVCWQQLALSKDLKIHYAPLTSDGVIDVDYCLALLKQYPIKIVSMLHISNALGTVQPIEKIFKEAKDKGAITIADMCQSLPIYLTSLDDLYADFAVISGHKVYAPSGIGCVLIQEKQMAESLPPYQTGGGMIAEVATSHSTFAASPTRFEAGTPFIEGAYLFSQALRFGRQHSQQEYQHYCKILVQCAKENLSQIEDLQVLYLHNDYRLPLFSVVFSKIHAHDLATFMDAHGVCARAGHHCCMPLMRQLDIPATLRLSFHLYNTVDEVRQCCAVLQKARDFFYGR